MFGTVKLKGLIYSVTISLVSSLISCSGAINNNSPTGITFQGNTQGTTYTVILSDTSTNLTKVTIDSLLHEFDLSLSTYIDNSVISALNSDSSVISVVDSSGFFRACYERSKTVFTETDGAFDPSVMPLVKGWGFMQNVESPLSQVEVDSILTFVGLNDHHEIQFIGDTVVLEKKDPRFQLDFNAVAQGYSVDLVADLIRSKGHKNFYVEIGGELIVSGTNREGNKWRIGVDAPEENTKSREIENILHVSDQAIATSGNYRKFYEKDGVKYAHTLNPKTGFPVTHSLLSATVLAPTAAEADALATAFMVLGSEKALEYAANHTSVEVYLLESNRNDEIIRKVSKGFEQYFSEN